MTKISWPCGSQCSIRFEPRHPAPPVIRMRMMRSELGMRRFEMGVAALHAVRLPMLHRAPHDLVERRELDLAEVGEGA